MKAISNDMTNMVTEEPHTALHRLVGRVLVAGPRPSVPVLPPPGSYPGDTSPGICEEISRSDCASKG